MVRNFAFKKQKYTTQKLKLNNNVYSNNCKK